MKFFFDTEKERLQREDFRKMLNYELHLSGILISNADAREALLNQAEKLLHSEDYDLPEMMERFACIIDANSLEVKDLITRHNKLTLWLYQVDANQRAILNYIATPTRTAKAWTYARETFKLLFIVKQEVTTTEQILAESFSETVQEVTGENTQRNTGLVK